jgi:hypothetical protein
MASFTRILIAVVFCVMFGTAYLASSQGWWWYTFSSASVQKQYEKENEEYRTYRSGSSFSRSGFRHSGSRSFRSGSRSGRGK